MATNPDKLPGLESEKDNRLDAAENKQWKEVWEALRFPAS